MNLLLLKLQRNTKKSLSVCIQKFLKIKFDKMKIVPRYQIFNQNDFIKNHSESIKVKKIVQIL